MNKGFLLLTSLLLLTFLSVTGKIVRIHVSPSQTEIGQFLLNRTMGTGHGDSVFVYLPAGQFTMSKSVSFKSNVFIQGAGASQTAIVMCDHANFNGDSFLKVDGTKDATLAFCIKGVSVSLQKHDGILWNEKTPKFLIRVNHAHLIEMDGVNSFCDNAFCTNLDMRICDNVTITNSKFVNFNNCKMGGNVWFRGQVNNVLMENDTIVKYGNDEAIAFFEDGDDAHSKYSGPTCKKQHIALINNQFVYGYDGDDKQKMDNNVFFSFFTHNKDTQTLVEINDVVVSNNTFIVNDPVNSVLCLLFRSNVKQQGVKITNNTFVSQAGSGGAGTRRMDIELRDATSDRNPIEVGGNKTIANSAIVDKNGYNSYTHLAIDGANVDFHDNQVVANVTTSNLAKNSRVGVVLVWTLASGGRVNMAGNVVKGLFLLSQASFGNGVKTYQLTAHNNYFQGDTRIVCNKVEQTDFSFTNNTFSTARVEFLLQEFGQRGSLVFNNNKVNCATGGTLMAHYNTEPLSSMRFDRLEVRGNVFNGCNLSGLLKNITNTGRKIVKNNTFSE